MTSDTLPQKEAQPSREPMDLLSRGLRHPALRVAAVMVVVAAALHTLFFAVAPWLWKVESPVDMDTVVPWARWAMNDRDGAEPYGLLALVLLACILTWSVLTLVERLPARWQARMLAAALVAAAMWTVHLPPSPPYPSPSADAAGRLMSVAAALALAGLATAAVRRRGAEVLLTVAVVGICLVRTSTVRPSDLECILAPALRLHRGFRLSEVYMQYDLLPSLLALAWRWIGGAAIQFASGVMAWGFLFLFLGMFFLARRMFARQWLAAPLLVVAIWTRYYAQLADPVAYPQTTPFRLDWWLLVVAIVQGRGLRDPIVGLVLGALCFFSRSMGLLCLLGWMCALAVDSALIFAEGERSRARLWRELVRQLRAVGPSLFFIVAAFVAVRISFGRWTSDAVTIYRRLGIGMLKVSPSSSFWWMLPILAATGYLAVRQQREQRSKSGEASLAAVATVAFTASYFFGRSHEHNLVNLSAGFVFCFFLGLDRLVTLCRQEERWAWPVEVGMGLLAVLAAAHSYAGGFVAKATAQVAQITVGRPPPETNPSDPVPPFNCGELAAAIGDPRVFFFSQADYYFYDYCGYVPQGYFQPLYLAPLVEPLTAELLHLLDGGYAIVVPRDVRDWGNTFDEFAPRLGALTLTTTDNYRIFRRPPK